MIAIFQGGARDPEAVERGSGRRGRHGRHRDDQDARAARVSRARASAARGGGPRGRGDDLRRSDRRLSGSDRAELRGNRHRDLLGRRRCQPGPGAEGRPPGRRRDRQQLRVANGPVVPARRAGGEPARPGLAPGHRRESELLHHPDGRRAEAAPRPCAHQARRGVHLPGGGRRGQERARRVDAAGSGDSRPGDLQPAEERSSTSSRST